MIQVLFHSDKRTEWIDSQDTVEAAVDMIRQHWHEDDDFQLYSLRDDNGVIQATMMTGETSDHCITTYRSGKIEVHLIYYRLNSEGRYISTDVQSVGTAGIFA